MIKKLLEVEMNIVELLQQHVANGTLNSLYIDYEPPTVERMWFQHGDNRVLLHKIHVCDAEPLFHPHPWKSAVRIVLGSYEMQVGHSATDERPAVDCTIIMPQGSLYEMVEMDGWHSVRPLVIPSYSLMLIGERYNRKMPVEPNKEFRALTDAEIKSNLSVFEGFYKGL